MSVERRTRIGVRTLVSAIWRCSCSSRVGLGLLTATSSTAHAVWQAITPAGVHAFSLTLEIALIAVPLNTIFGVRHRAALVRGRFRAKPGRCRHQACRSPALARGHRLGAAARLRARRVVSLPFQVHLRRARDGACHRLRLAALRRAEVAPVLRRDRRRAGAAAATRGATRWQVFWAHHTARDPLGVAYGVVLTTRGRSGEFGAS